MKTKFAESKELCMIICLHDTSDAQAFYELAMWARARGHELSFDDGYASWYDIALPILKALDMTATFFVCSGGLAECTDTHGPYYRNLGLANPPRPLSILQLRELARDHIIGSHGLTHMRLAGIRASDKATIEQELKSDIEGLSNLLDRPIRHFAFPFGQAQDINLALLPVFVRLGIEKLYTTMPFNIGPIIRGRVMVPLTEHPLKRWARLALAQWKDFLWS